MIARIANYLSKLLNALYIFLFHGNLGIMINSWNKIRFGRITHRNFGDELNFYLLHELTGKNIYNYIDLPNCITKGKSNYLFIGSLVEEFCTPDTIVWGSGAIEGGSRQLRNKPKKVLAVRGKLTREYLMDNGVECPEIYGDPALLLPLVYKPQVIKEYKMGIIPHVDDLLHPAVLSLKNQGALVIRLDQYEEWHEVVDQICQCEFIVSSSLHGLIISDAYGIPNIWTSLYGNLLGGTFKFFDYFSSVNRATYGSVQLSESTTIIELEAMLSYYHAIEYDPTKLIEASPWPLILKYPNN